MSGFAKFWERHVYLQTMYILIYLESEFYDAFDGHIYIYAPHRTFGLFEGQNFGPFQKKHFYVQYVCQSTRLDLKSSNLQSELKYLNGISRKIDFCDCKISFLVYIYKNTFLAQKWRQYMSDGSKFRYMIYKKCFTEIGEIKTHKSAILIEKSTKLGFSWFV